ncbi:hypothetical protein HYH03_004913 [Edaphochlamys debaryana]|uniref:Uncharacterized protein n=1 Tax=Edaphochlamys debaryana TaxID=47281 RepID=A0A835Y5V5_9CHLO|nr:hypothetical protein HYH03_004913 [Edaphochlamys debaryana]|eukprot:KAG2496907.1 hypothetical protein HYH03_004913 [Edaphochlamys debaryana]
MLLSGADVDAGNGSAGNGEDSSSLLLEQLSGSPSMPQQQTVMQTLASLPTSLTVQTITDAMQAAGLINFTFSQSAHSSFVLNTQLDQAGSTSVAVLTQALRVVLAARKINQQAVARFDLGFVPFLVSDAAEGIGLLIYKCSLSNDKTRGSVLKVDTNSNPLVAGISLFNMLQSGPQQLEVIFTAEACKVALQALAIMRINLANNGRDVLLLLSTVDYAADASGPKNYFLLKLTPITPPLPCFQHQIEALKPQVAAYMGPGDGGMMGHSLAAASMGAAYGKQGSMGPLHGGGMGMGGGQLGMAGAGPKPHGMAPPQLAYGQQMGVGAGGMGAAGSAKQQRARKADYVIVTEDTAIKNAAGAIAKVLGRVSNQGQCCPVYTEKKTESFTTVISVAVKAIAVARGYVCNEGMGNEVGFQPYLRHLDRRLDLIDLHHFLSGEKKQQGPAAAAAAVLSAAAAAGMAGVGHAHAQAMAGMMAAAAAGKGPGMGNPAAHNPLAHLANLQAMNPYMAHLHGGMGPGMTKHRSHNPLDSYELLDEEALTDERCELAFDVFKVPQLNELHDAGNLPVKVTAHSRPNVVSNIISKLVSERSGAVLITAGGKAMHVAMMAVVSARARLKAKGIDIILLPKFVTVDTTSTLGWESVFLRFTIVRWAPVPPSPAMHPDASMMAAAGGRYLLPQM